MTNKALFLCGLLAFTLLGLGVILTVVEFYRVDRASRGNPSPASGSE